MTYNPNIPQASDFIAVSQVDLLNNFTSANTIMDVNHYPFNNGTSNAGKHKHVSLPEQSAAPATAADEGAVYTKDVSNKTELFYRYDSSGREYPLTFVKGMAEFNGTGAFPIVAPANSYNIAQIDRISTGQYRFTYATPLANAAWGVFGVGARGTKNRNVFSYANSTTTSIDLFVRKIDSDDGENLASVTALIIGL